MDIVQPEVGADRALDALVAKKLMGWRVDFGRCFTAPGDIFVGERSIESVPRYSADYTAARQVEDEIERRGLWDRYTHELLKITTGGSGEEDPRRIGDDYRLSAAEVFAVFRATPEQRCRAALRAAGIEVA